MVGQALALGEFSNEIELSLRRSVPTSNAQTNFCKADRLCLVDTSVTRKYELDHRRSNSRLSGTSMRSHRLQTSRGTGTSASASMSPEPQSSPETVRDAGRRPPKRGRFDLQAIPRCRSKPLAFRRESSRVRIGLEAILESGPGGAEVAASFYPRIFIRPD